MTIKNYAKTIESRCDKDEETGCWNWTRATHIQGYGFMRHKNTMKTVQRIMAIELELFKDIDFHSRITNYCDNKLCANPDHIIACTQSEINYARYKKHGTGGKFEGKEEAIRNEYNHMKSQHIPRTINLLAEKYGCHPSMLYRAIETARKRSSI